MTDQCFDEPDRGREPTTLSVNTTYSHALPEEWIRVNTSAIRNTASKLELAKKALTDICDLNKTLHIWEAHEIARNAIRQLEDD
jgi:hypothetical protein